MRRTLAAAALLAAFAGAGLSAAPAMATCGGGQPGEPCYCPDIKIITIYCK